MKHESRRIPPPVGMVCNSKQCGRDLVVICAPYVLLPVMVAIWTGIEDLYEEYETGISPFLRGCIIVAAAAILALCTLRTTPYSGRAPRALGQATRNQLGMMVVVLLIQEYAVVHLWSALYVPIEYVLELVASVIAPTYAQVATKCILSHVCIVPFVWCQAVLLQYNHDTY